MSFEHHECTARDGSTLEAYDVGVNTIVLRIHDVSSFQDGPHDARIELPLGQLRELFNAGFATLTFDMDDTCTCTGLYGDGIGRCLRHCKP